MSLFPPYTRPAATLLDMIADLLLLGAGLGVLVFAVGYAVLFRWWETASGRTILAFVGTLGLILLLNITIRAAGGDFPGRDYARVAVDTVVFVAAWGLVVLLARSWLRGAPALHLRERESVKRTPTQEGPTIMPESTIPTEPAGFETVDERILNVVEIARLEDGSTLNAQNVGVPTQVANPWRATLRTVTAALVGIVLALPVVNLILLEIQSELLASGLELPAWLWAAVNGTIAAVALVSGIITRVLAIPGVNAWLGQHALTRGLTAIRLERSTPLPQVGNVDSAGDPIVY